MSSGASEAASATDELEERICQLQKEKADLETEFGLKCAQFRETFIQQEEELNKERAKCLANESRIEAMGEELSSMQTEVDKLHWELEGVRTAAAVSETNKEEEINCIVAHYQQEVVSLQQLLKEAEETATASPAAAQYESERNKLVSLNVNYEEQIQELRNRLSQEKESFLSAVAKSIKRVGIIASANTASKEPGENLEDSMKKAQEEAQILKSVVVPLENEIKTLKARLHETEAKLADALKKNGPPQGNVESRAYDYRSQNSPSLPELDSITDVNEKVERLFSYLKSEKAARKDLEMYVAVLSTQKSMLQDEADKINSELQDVCRLLEEEKHSHEALKQTWQMANDQYLESQRLLMMDMRRMEGVLTTEQQRQIADLKRKASNDVPVKVFLNVPEHHAETEHPLRRQTSMPDIGHIRKLRQKDDTRDSLERKVKELEEKRKVHEQEQEAKQKLKQAKIGRSKRSREGSPASSLSAFRATSQIGGSLPSIKDGTYSKSSSISSSGPKGAYHSASSSDIGDDLTREETDDDSIFIDFCLQETQSLSEADGISHEGKESCDSMTVVRISPEKVLNLPPLTAAQMKAITDPTPEAEAHKSLVAGIKSKSGSSKLNLEGKRLVSEAEWILLEEEMRAAREKLGQPCSMCNNYETQLQTVQEELQSSQMQVKQLEKSLSAEKETNRYLQQCQEELQLAVKNAAEDSQMLIIDLGSRLQVCEECIKNFREQMSVTHLQLQDHCKTLEDSREEVQRELTKLQEENDSLVSKYSKTAQQLQNEDINLPSSPQEMELLLLKYREEIISAKVAKEHTEETLKNEIMLLKSQVLGEHQEKETLKATLDQEIAALEAKHAEVHTLQQQLEEERAVRTQTETKLQDSESSLKNMQIRSKQLLGKMQERLEDMDKKTSKLESDNHTLKGKVHALQADLRNSEAVQRDFVKLSQSLQVQLEKIRQAENEVRWQHEDDVDECNNCKISFTVTRRKHHCRHCGRIFCSDCTAKSVPSGSSLRPSKVCDVCHTILVKDATPYFGTEAPVT